MEEKPSLGRIVLWCGPDGVEHPAIITRLWTDNLVNLHVFFDAHEAEGGPKRTSVEQSSQTTPDGHSTPMQYRWRWPPRV